MDNFDFRFDFLITDSESVFVPVRIIKSSLVLPFSRSWRHLRGATAGDKEIWREKSMES